MGKTAWRGLFVAVAALALMITAFVALTHQASASLANNRPSHHAPAKHRKPTRPTSTPTTTAITPTKGTGAPTTTTKPVTTPSKPSAPTSTSTSPVTTSPGSTTRSFYVTLYGWPDNSPPGGAIAYPKSDGNPTLHNTAGGTGTFADPVTYATDKAELPVGTKVYYPFLKKYFVMEDDCAECDQDWTGHSPKPYHIDLWVGGQGGTTNKVLDCEDTLTQQGNVVVNPPSDEPVVTTPLFNSSTNTCYGP
jgi:hypothetical protein